MADAELLTIKPSGQWLVGRDAKEKAQIMHMLVGDRRRPEHESTTNCHACHIRDIRVIRGSCSRFSSMV